MLRLAATPAFPVALALAAIAAAVLALPFLAELPVYLEDAKRLAGGDSLPVDAPFSYAFGYSLFLAPLVALGGEAMIVAAQAILQLILVLVFWRSLKRASVTGPLLLLGTAAVALHPYLLLNVQRVNESAVAVLLFFAIAQLLMVRERDVGAWAALGMALAALILLRPNAVSLVPVPFIAMLLRRSPSSAALPALAMCAAGLAVYVAASLVATGELFFWPANGAYNLFAGNNPFAAEYLLSHQNGEQSLWPALAAYGYRDVLPTDVPPQVYLDLLVRFAGSDPLEAVKLFFLKVGVFFSPRLFNVDTAFEAAMQWVLALPAPVWLVLLVLARKRLAVTPDGIVVLLVAFYCLPFFVSNADPRMRLPVDILIVFHCLVMLRRLREKFAAAAPAAGGTVRR